MMRIEKRISQYPSAETFFVPPIVITRGLIVIYIIPYIVVWRLLLLYFELSLVRVQT